MLGDVRGVSVVSICISLGMSCHLSIKTIMVIVASKVIAVLHKRRAAAKWHNLKAMTGQFKVACDLWTEQTAYVRAVRVIPAFVELSAYRRAADVRVAL